MNESRHMPGDESKITFRERVGEVADFTGYVAAIVSEAGKAMLDEKRIGLTALVKQRLADRKRKRQAKHPAIGETIDDETNPRLLE